MQMLGNMEHLEDGFYYYYSHDKSSNDHLKKKPNQTKNQNLKPE